jgi:hypothetical protein
MQTRPLVGRGYCCDWLPARPFGSETTPAAPSSQQPPACPGSLLRPNSRRSRAAKRRSPRPARHRVCQPAPPIRHAPSSVQPNRVQSRRATSSRLVDAPAPLGIPLPHPSTATPRPALLGMGMGMIPTHTRCRCPRLGASVAPSLARSSHPHVRAIGALPLHVR